MRDEPPSRPLKQPGAAFWLVGALVLLAVFGLAGWKYFLAGVKEVPTDVGTPLAPPFDLAALDGSRYELSDFSGRVLLLELWATWCGPCRLQADILARLYNQVQGPGVEFLAVSLGEDEAVVRSFVQRDPFPYPVILDPEETLGYALEVYALPTVVVVDKNSRITFIRPGISDAETLRRALLAADSERQADAGL